MVIQSNILAMNAGRMFGITDATRKKSIEKLSSGYKINRAADDAAGLAISEKMRRQIRGLNQAAQNVQDGISYCQVADGALNEVHDMLHRMSELSVKAANGTLTDTDRAYIDSEVQSIKTECKRIFSETSFNERLIWEPNEKVLIGTEKAPAVKELSFTDSFGVTNDNYDVLPAGSFQVNADSSTGVSVSWRDYNNKDHSTTPISWEDLKNKNYTFNISDYYGGPTGANADLYDSDGKALYDYKVTFRPDEYATVDDIVSSINGVNISTSKNAYLYGEFETPSGGLNVSASMPYSAAYASRKNSTEGRDFDNANDAFFEAVQGTNGVTGNLITSPSSTDVASAKTDTTGWEFSFYLQGVGNVKASSTGISYYSHDTDDPDEGRWWNWIKPSNGPRYKGTNLYSAEGNLAGLMSTLTGDKGLLSKNPSSGEAGMSDAGGYIAINFALTAENNYTYGGSSSNNAGTMTISLSVSTSDTQESILNKVQNALNSNTVVDLKTNSGGDDQVQFYKMYVRNNTIDVPLYGGICDLPIQAGTERGHVIDIRYDSLNIDMLHIRSSNVLTVEDAREAIDAFKSAETIISEQRSVFGAYQNRLEHAYSIDKISEENTQAAESRIRDTDMATEMIRLSTANILAQAGTSMITQANQAPETVLSLLQ